MGDFNGDNYTDKFMGELVNFVASNKFQTMFENYFITYALEFDNNEEHKLRYTELYNNFHDMFEKQLEEFCDSVGISQSEFMRKCRESTTEDPKAKHYINILMSSVEYDTFVKLMRIMRPVAAQRAALKADMKDTADAKDSGMKGGAGPGADEGPASAAKAAKGDAGSWYEGDSDMNPRSPVRAEGKFADEEDRGGHASAKLGAK